VRHLGVDHGVWTDHTDTRPTVLALLGLKDDYRADGRVIFEILRSDATPDGLHQDRAALNVWRTRTSSSTPPLVNSVWTA